MRELKLNDSAELEGVKKYTLEQYTPHIHFQADEEGACLRASEVKPKLDKFLLSYLSRKKLLECVPEEWFIVKEDKNNRVKEDKNNRALNYKVSICGIGTPTLIDNFKNTSYFGNMGGNNDKKGVLYESGLKLTIIAGSQTELKGTEEYSLLGLVDHCLPAFFAFNCFGTRSTKGWGSYGIADNVQSDNNVQNDTYLGEFYELYYKCQLKENSTWEQKLEVIRLLAGMMKGGFNYGGYYKGRIFRYYSKHGVGSDKAYMKRYILPGKLDKNDKSESRKNYNQYVYSRGLLGLTDNYEFKPGKKTKRKGRIGVFYKATKDDISIDRFNNPIHFIVSGSTIIMLPTEIPIRGQWFEFIEVDDKYKPIESKDKTGIVIPEYFDLEHFIDYFIKELRDRKDFEVKEKRGQETMTYKLDDINASLYGLSSIECGDSDKKKYVIEKFKGGEKVDS